MKYLTYAEWKQSTGLGSGLADRFADYDLWVSESSYAPADGIDTKILFGREMGLRPGDIFCACIELNNELGLVDTYEAYLHFLTRDHKETGLPLAAYEKISGTANVHKQKFRTRNGAEQYLKRLVESGGVETDAIKAMAKKEEVAVRKYLHEAEQKDYQKRNSGCMLLVLPFLIGATLLLWG